MEDHVPQELWSRITAVAQRAKAVLEENGITLSKGFEYFPREEVLAAEHVVSGRIELALTIELCPHMAEGADIVCPIEGELVPMVQVGLYDLQGSSNGVFFFDPEQDAWTYVGDYKGSSELKVFFERCEPRGPHNVVDEAEVLRCLGLMAAAFLARATEAVRALN